MNRVGLSLIAGFILICGGRTAAQEVDQTSAPLGQFFDPDNLDNINKLQGAA